MEPRQIGFIGISLLVGVLIGFLAYQQFYSLGYSKQVDFRVGPDEQVENVSFDGNSFEMRFEDIPEARFYFYFDDRRGLQELDVERDGNIRTKMEIRSFGQKTYLFYIRYRDDPNSTEGDFMEIYRIEEA